MWCERRLVWCGVPSEEGMYAGMSILQGGPGFPFLHQHVYMYLCTDVWSPLSVASECIPDQNIQEVVTKVRFV